MSNTIDSSIISAERYCLANNSVLPLQAYNCQALDSVAGHLVDEGGEPALCASSGAHPRLMKSVDPHGERSEPLFDRIPLGVVEVTEQVTPRERGRVAHSVDEKHCSEWWCFSASRPRYSAAGSVPRRSETTAPIRSFVSTSIAAYSQCYSVPMFTVVSSTAPRDGFAVGGSMACSAVRWTHWNTA